MLLVFHFFGGDNGKKRYSQCLVVGVCFSLIGS